jgi:hypothetical protein
MFALSTPVGVVAPPSASPRAAPRRAAAAPARCTAGKGAGSCSASLAPAPRAATLRRRDARAAASGRDAAEVFTAPVFLDPATATNWHFLIANADFMLNDENSEHFPEVLRERRRFFLENNAAVNFFVVPNPAWLKDLPEVAKRVRTPAVALVSPDATWIMCVRAWALRWRDGHARRRTRRTGSAAAQPCGALGPRADGCPRRGAAEAPERPRAAHSPRARDEPA